MCGRYVLKASALELQHALHLDELPALAPRYNIAPLQAAPVLRQGEAGRLHWARWGLLPPWARDARLAARAINARAETAATKRLFQAALSADRCLVPCDGFYEWRHDGPKPTPHFLRPRSGGVATFAGVVSPWRSPDGAEVLTFAVLTTAAGPDVAPLHHRMPVFIPPEARVRWLTGTMDMATLAALARPEACPGLEVYQVTPLVNTVANDSPACLEPARSVQLSLF